MFYRDDDRSALYTRRAGSTDCCNTIQCVGYRARPKQLVFPGKHLSLRGQPRQEIKYRLRLTYDCESV
jgi:hypothetical protein